MIGNIDDFQSNERSAGMQSAGSPSAGKSQAEPAKAKAHHPDELSRAYRLHAAFASAILPGQSINKALLYQKLRPELLAHGIDMTPGYFGRIIEQWLVDRKPESLLRRRHRDPATVPTGKTYQNALVLHQLLSEHVEPGQHADVVKLFRELRPDLKDLGFPIDLDLFQRLLSKWRKDRRPAALLRLNPVRHRISMRTMIRHVRDHAIRNAVSLRAAWTTLKRSKSAGSPSWKSVRTATTDHLLIDRFADYAANVKASEADMRAEISALAGEMKSPNGRRSLEGVITTLCKTRIDMMRNLLFFETGDRHE